MTSQHLTAYNKNNKTTHLERELQAMHKAIGISAYITDCLGKRVLYVAAEVRLVLLFVLIDAHVGARVALVLEWPNEARL